MLYLASPCLKRLGFRVQGVWVWDLVSGGSYIAPTRFLGVSDSGRRGWSGPKISEKGPVEDGITGSN